MTAGSRERAWWDEGVLYQVYVRSFRDSDGDGVGDLDGVRAGLDHLAWLGVDGIWLNPIHPSPNADWGYDVADYLDVADGYGGMAAFDRLVSDAEARGIRVVLDLVPNHTSDRHPWFLDARSGRDARHRDWYVWADPAPDGGPPNNWLSVFGGSAWEFDRPSGQYYLHQFLREQPDLNWWNDEVREAFDGIVRFWFQRGAAGFRIDVANAIVKDRHLRDDPFLPVQDGKVPDPRAFAPEAEIYSHHRPEVHRVLERWRTIADAYEPSRVLIGETWARDLPDLARYYGDGDGMNLAFNFAFATAAFDGNDLARVIDATERALGPEAWPLWTASNHDIGRLASRWGAGDPDRIRCALFLLVLLRGAPVLYYGDEIGLCDVPVPPSRRRDPGNRQDGSGRDDGRTPMIWTPEPGRGFTDGDVEPWLPFGDGHVSVAEQRGDPASVLSWCRDVIALRRTRPELRRGGSDLLDAPDGVVAWRRSLRQDGGPTTRTVAAANVSPRRVAVPLVDGEALLATEGVRDEGAGTWSLPAWGVVAVSSG
ncbi:MAG TPA: alpha-amylase family glycosyl hydrolase [Actinomycetota bacterium]|nr:alpha-amylase family glycosyl hydrolase [Actinomycetota bacterium]